MVFPVMAATINRSPIVYMFSPVSPLAINAPIAKSSESPGRNGVITKPVSAKIIMKIMR